MGFVHDAVMVRIEQDLQSGEAVFPTSMRLAAAIRNLLEQPSASVDEMVHLVSQEPLIATRLLRLANSVAFNPYGQSIVTVDEALVRVGLNALRTVTLAVLMRQMQARLLRCDWALRAEAAWERSLALGTLARVLARAERRCNPDTALLSGLVSEIGVFFLLSRAQDCAGYADDPARLDDLLDRHAVPVGLRLLRQLEVPEPVCGALLALSGETDLPTDALQLGQVLAEARAALALNGALPPGNPLSDGLAQAQAQAEAELAELRHALHA